MVQHISQVITEYEERLRRSCYVPRFSYGRPMLWDDGAPNRCFLMYLFSEESIAIQFLKDIGPTPYSILTIFRLGLVLFFYSLKSY